MNINEHKGGVVGKEAKRKKNNKERVFSGIPVVAFPTVHRADLCRKLPGMVCLQNTSAFLGSVQALIVPEQMDKLKSSRSVYCDCGHC